MRTLGVVSGGERIGSEVRLCGVTSPHCHLQPTNCVALGNLLNRSVKWEWHSDGLRDRQYENQWMPVVTVTNISVIKDSIIERAQNE